MGREVDAPCVIGRAISLVEKGGLLVTWGPRENGSPLRKIVGK